VVVGNLWDVTDRDIDRFATRVLQHWCDTQAEPQPGAQPQSSARASSSSNSGGVRSSSLQCGSSGLQEAVSVSQSLALSRQACRLPTLIGSAAVCFGLPALVQPQHGDTA
jgi:separase